MQTMEMSFKTIENEVESKCNKEIDNRFRIFGYTAEEISMYKFALNSRSKEPADKSKYGGKYGEELLELVPCRCDSAPEGMQCPVCNIKMLRKREDDRVISERLANALK
jgi:hypothetical protein